MFRRGDDGNVVGLYETVHHILVLSTFPIVKYVVYEYRRSRSSLDSRGGVYAKFAKDSGGSQNDENAWIM
eukprot:1179792-Prorocentrum_minimum.AAC.2